MALGDGCRAGTPHEFEGCGFGRERLGHGMDQRVHGAGGNEPTVDAVLDEFGVTGDVSCDDGPAQGERFEHDDRETFGEAGENQGSSSEELISDILIAEEAGDADGVLKLEVADEAFDFGPHVAVADDGELAGDALIAEACDGLDEDGVAFLLDDAADVDETVRVGDGSGAVFEEEGADAEPDDMDFGPVLVIRPAQELAAGEFADGNDKLGEVDFITEGPATG